jgi:hypothetical protein
VIPERVLEAIAIPFIEPSFTGYTGLSLLTILPVLIRRGESRAATALISDLRRYASTVLNICEAAQMLMIRSNH